MTAPIYAVGDIHGQLSMLDDAPALIEADGGAGEPVVFRRDYVDRGPDSAGVLTRSCQRNFA
jgi:serine/threonine protein phosphatase 1